MQLYLSPEGMLSKSFGIYCPGVLLSCQTPSRTETLTWPCRRRSAAAWPSPCLLATSGPFGIPACVTTRQRKKPPASCVRLVTSPALESPKSAQVGHPHLIQIVDTISFHRPHTHKLLVNRLERNPSWTNMKPFHQPQFDPQLDRGGGLFSHDSPAA